jgi:hypothetical protein
MGLPKDLKTKFKENLVIIKVLQGNSHEKALRECQKIVWDETLEAIGHQTLSCKLSLMMMMIMHV